MGFEGAFINDSRKRRAGGIWANVTLPNHARVDKDVKRLIDEFRIDDLQVVRSLAMHAAARPPAFRKDMSFLRNALRGSRDPTSVLASELQKMMQPSAGTTKAGAGG